MKDGEPSTHADNILWRNEPKSAAYLKFSELADFRKFRFHYVALNWYFVYMDYSQSQRPEVSLQLIKDIADVDEFFPANIDTLITNSRKFCQEELNCVNTLRTIPGKAWALRLLTG